MKLPRQPHPGAGGLDLSQAVRAVLRQPIERLLCGGLHHHHAASAALFEAFGTPGYAPARRSVVAARRKAKGA